MFGPKSAPKKKRNWQPPAEDMVLSLDKNWHVLHYLLSCAPWDGPLPKATLMCGGDELGTVDVGYGPARILKQQQISEFLDYLENLKKENFALGVTSSEL